MKNKNAVIYVRVSTEEQAKKGYSIDAQIQRCRDFADRMGYSVTKIFIEQGKSAKDLNRPELQKMLKYCKSSILSIDFVIFWKWDRLSRGDESDYVKLEEFFKSNCIKPLSTEENNDETPEADLTRRITYATNKYELDKDSQRTKLGLKRKAEEGHFPGKAPLGYLNKRDEKDRGYVVVDTKISKFIIKAFDYYSSGLYSLESLGKQLYTEGFKNKHNEAYPARKFEEILKNPFYIGKFRWNDQLYEGKHTPLIPTSLFYKVQDMFGKTNKPMFNNKVFTYSKLMTCSKCGCYLTAEHKKGAHNSGNYIYYHCTNKKKIHENQRSIKEEQLDIVAQDIFSSFSIPNEIVKLAKNSILSNLDNLYVAENDLIEYRLNRVKELGNIIRKSREEKLLGKSFISDDIYNSQMSEWQKELDMLKINIRESKSINKRIYNNIALITKFCSEIPELYKNADIQDKQLMLRTIIDEISYADGEITVKLKPVFEYLRLIKDIETKTKLSDKVRTLKSVDNIEINVKNPAIVCLPITKKVRTLKTRIIPNKKAPEGANDVNGAPDGIRTHAYRNHNPRS